MKHERVIILGIDGGSWRVLRGAIAGGYMPFMKGLLEVGASGVLESTMPAITPAAWGSFQTGMNPGENGVHDFFQWDKKDKQATVVNSTHLRETIWDVAGRAGRRVGVVNVPMTYPPREVNGYLVTGLLTPSLESDFTYPQALKGELLEAVRGYKILNLDRAGAKAPGEDFVGYVEQMAGDVESRASAAEFILAKERLDLLMVHFQASDVIQHNFWGYLTEESPFYDAQKQAYLFERFYSQLDRQMRRVYELFWKDSEQPGLTFVVSDHGFQSNKVVVNLGVWLKRHGYLKVRGGQERPRLLKRITRRLGVGRLLSRFISADRMSRMEALVLEPREVLYEWADSKAYARGGNCEGFIYLLEEDQAKRAKTEQELMEQLGSLRDPAGQAVVRRVYRKEEIFHGRHVDIMPDLVVDPVDGYSFKGTYRAGIEIFRTVEAAQDIHVGKHHKDGILVVSGPGVPHQEALWARITDVAPTVQYAMSLPIRKDCDGGVLQQLFSDEFLAAHPSPSVYDVEDRGGRSDEVYDAQDRERIEERLRDLGYL